MSFKKSLKKAYKAVKHGAKGVYKNVKADAEDIKSYAKSKNFTKVRGFFRGANQELDNILPKQNFNSNAVMRVLPKKRYIIGQLPDLF